MTDTMHNHIGMAWDYLVETGIATEEEMKLVTSINGYKMESINDVIYVRTGLRDTKQLEEG